MVKSVKSTLSKTSRSSKKLSSSILASKGIEAGPRRVLRSSAKASLPAHPDSPSLIKKGPDPNVQVVQDLSGSEFPPLPPSISRSVSATGDHIDPVTQDLGVVLKDPNSVL